MKKKVVSSKSKYQKIESKLLTRFRNLLSSDREAKKIYNALNKGKASYLRVDRVESTSYDVEWIEKIEDAIGDLGDIVNNPKKTIKTVTDVVPVELAKKTTAESVRHLSMNSQFVKSIDEEGNIIPDKILNISADDDYMTYENKFIATLIKHLVIFVEKRYEFVSKYALLKKHEILYYKNFSVVDGSEVEIETKVKVAKKAEDVSVLDSDEYLARIDKVRTYLKYYYTSDFMKMFKNERDVRAPIIMTNILRKNPKYNKCYNLYRYIERYNKMGVSYSVDEHYFPFTKKEMADVNNFVFANFLALKGDDPSKKPLSTNKKKYVPRVLKTLDDDMFVFSPISNKPIEYIRVDDYYKEYLKKNFNVPLKKTPTKEEAKYHEEEYKKKEDYAVKSKALLKLETRKKKEEEKFLKKQQELLEKQKHLEELERQKLEREKKLEYERRLQAARKLIKDAAIEDRKEEEEHEEK